MVPKIAVIGEYQSNNTTHIALNKSVEHAVKKLGSEISIEWIDTETLQHEGEKLLKDYAGIWSAPGSPFKSLEGALKGIEYARTNNIPHIGTCAGFQHAVIEFARNILKIEEAQHEEYDPDSSSLFISKLDCSLAGKRMTILIREDTFASKAYGVAETEENYYCNFGINPEFKNQLIHPSLRISGIDQDNEIRIIEVPDHRFFVATLFVPQTNSTPELPHPLIMRFVEECLK